jgi:Uma2 family endonuclease
MTQLLENPVKRQPKRWTKQEYHAAVDRGLFVGQRIYLYRGELIQMASMGALLVRGISNVTIWLVRTFDPDYAIRCQSPFELPDESVPQPEFAVVTHQQQARLPHANEAVLIVEVADSSIELDQDMALDYAAAGVSEYWIVNVRDRNVEIYRAPAADPGSPTGYRYSWCQIFNEAESISSLARPGISVNVATLLK